jgi:predicted O-methyltransferase YrrM
MPGMSTVMATRRLELPELVHRAESLAIAMRFELSSSPEIGRLLAVLVSQRPHGRFAEIGSGCGVGSAWIVSAMGPEATFVTVEADEERAGAVARLFADQPQVRVLHGDWHDVLPAEAPFDLLFFDGGSWKHGDVEVESEAALELVAPGGLVVIDDLTPESLWPEEWRGRPDAVREFWLADPRLRGAEVMMTPKAAAIVATVATKNPC